MWPDSNGGPKEFNLPQILRILQKFYKFAFKNLKWTFFRYTVTVS